MHFDTWVRWVAVVRAWVVLRKAGKVGILYVEEGKFWVSNAQYGDYYTYRERKTLEQLEAIVVAEFAVKKGPQKEDATHTDKRKTG